MLFEAISIGRLTLRNRVMRSATAECMAHPESGHPLETQGEMYAALARGGVGLIVTGHAYVERGGQAHLEMASIASDDVIPAWRKAIRPAQAAGARVMMQINHGGSACDAEATPDTISPSGVVVGKDVKSGVMSGQDIERVVKAFGQAARRAREAGLDGVQLHGAHGYLTSQFLSPTTNRREDAWGGDAGRRFAFLKAIIQEARRQVGDDYPLWLKLGVAGSEESQFEIADGARIAADCAKLGIDCIEISHAVGEPKYIDMKQEAPYKPWAEAVRQAVGDDFPLALVNRMLTHAGMQALLDSGLVQMVSLCRPLIAEPDLLHKLRQDSAYEHACVRCWTCWPKELGQGVACRNVKTLRRLGRPAPKGAEES